MGRQHARTAARIPAVSFTPALRNLSAGVRSQEPDLDATMTPLGSAPATPPRRPVQSHDTTMRYPCMWALHSALCRPADVVSSPCKRRSWKGLACAGSDGCPVFDGQPASAAPHARLSILAQPASVDGDHTKRTPRYEHGGLITVPPSDDRMCSTVCRQLAAS